MRSVKADGFTLIELLTAVAVLAILASIAVPSFSAFSSKQRLRGATIDLRTDLTLARSEALKRNSAVTVSARTAAGWVSGWVVTAGGETLRSRNDIGAGVLATAAADAITFDGNGRVSSPAGTFEIELSSSTGADADHRCLSLDPAGMPRTYRESCS